MSSVLLKRPNFTRVDISSVKLVRLQGFTHCHATEPRTNAVVNPPPNSGPSHREGRGDCPDFTDGLSFLTVSPLPYDFRYATYSVTPDVDTHYLPVMYFLVQKITRLKRDAKQLAPGNT